MRLSFAKQLKSIINSDEDSNSGKKNKQIEFFDLKSNLFQNQIQKGSKSRLEAHNVHYSKSFT